MTSQTPETRVRALKLSEWPLIDQRHWQEACRPGGRLSRGGRASALKPVTRKDLECRYGLYLDFLNRTDRLLTGEGSATLITRENIAAYLDEITKRVSSVTVHGAVTKLRRMGELLVPGWDSAWLRDIEQELAWDMKPRPKFDLIVDSDRLVEAGFALMCEAEAGEHLPPVRRRMLYRDGLMLALLAVCPIRLKNFAALEIGTSLKKVENTWIITLPSSTTKSGRPDERVVPEMLTSALEKYLSSFRRTSEVAEGALWIGRTGSPLSYSEVERIVTLTTRRVIGVSVSPHLFRSCASSYAYRYGHDTPGLASALLQHSDPRVTERHYNRARSVGFGIRFLRIVEGWKQDPFGSKHRSRTD